ncbi:MAG: DUF1440 domain-containing protein [Roseiflexaceae bacterium]
MSYPALSTTIQGLRQRPFNRWRGLVLGSVGGAAGTLIMGLYFKAIKRLTSDAEQPSSQPATHNTGVHALDDISLIGKHYQAGEDSTIVIGRIAYQTLVGVAPKSQETKALLGQAVHWSFGVSMGALYGILRDTPDWPDLGGGLIFGASVWLFASELMLPLLGVAPGPTKSPVQKHAQEFGAHLLYGAVVAAVAQLVQRLFARK